MTRSLQVTIPVKNDELRDIIIAELISIGFGSFEEDSEALKAFAQEDEFDQEELETLLQHHEMRYLIEPIAEKNWNEEWEKNFEPVIIGDFCSVRASFHERNMATQYEVVITPKMSFGTGHHATTHMMLELMQRLDFKNASVFDFGTGTGILSIMAEKLGAEEVLAIDVDEWSIRNAAENIEMNKCSKIRLQQADNIPADKAFKIILANINKNVILDSLPAMCKILAAKGEILLSGLLEADFHQVNNLATSLGLNLQRKGEKSGWIALSYVLQS